MTEKTNAMPAGPLYAMFFICFAALVLISVDMVRSDYKIVCLSEHGIMDRGTKYIFQKNGGVTPLLDGSGRPASCRTSERAEG